MIVSGSANLSQNFTVEAYSGNAIDANGNNTSLSGALTGAGGMTYLDSSGNGSTITLSGANTYSGTTYVENVTLQAGATNTFSPNSAVVMA